MKKNLVICIAMVLSLGSFAQKKEKVEVPSIVEKAFMKAYPGVKAKWSKEKDGGFEARFKQSGNDMSATYDASGTLEETEMDMKATDLPAAIQSYVKTNKKSAKITEAAKITKANGEVTYEAEVNGVDLMFDANGKFLKEVKEAKD